MKKGLKITIIISSVLLVAVAAFLLVWFLHFLPERDKDERTRLVEEYRAAKRARYAEENASLMDAEKYVLFLGDSLTDGCDVAHYYPGFHTLNRGIGGDRTYDVLDRMQVSVYDAKPSVVVLLIGGNNVLAGEDLHKTAAEYEEILKGIEEHLPETKVVVLSLTSMGGKCAVKNPDAALLNYKIKDLAAGYGYSFVDVFTPLFDPETMEICAEYTSDGAHLTDAGYRALSAAVTPAIKAALAK